LAQDCDRHLQIRPNIILSGVIVQKIPVAT